MFQPDASASPALNLHHQPNRRMLSYPPVEENITSSQVHSHHLQECPPSSQWSSRLKVSLPICLSEDTDEGEDMDSYEGVGNAGCNLDLPSNKAPLISRMTSCGFQSDISAKGFQLDNATFSQLEYTASLDVRSPTTPPTSPRRATASLKNGTSHSISEEKRRRMDAFLVDPDTPTESRENPAEQIPLNLLSSQNSQNRLQNQVPAPASQLPSVSSARRDRSHLYFDDELLLHGVIINVEFGFIICTQCSRPYLPAYISGHVRTKHRLPPLGAALLKTLVEHFNLFVNTQGVSEAWPTEVEPPVQGIAIKKGIHCSECVFASPSENTMRVHYSKKHNGISSGNMHQNRSIQSIYMTSQFDKWIQVQELLTGAPPHDPYAVWYRDRKLPPKLMPPGNGRETPPWLICIGWRDYVNKLDSEEVLPLLEPAKRADPFHWIVEALFQYLMNIKNTIADINIQILGWVQSYDG